MVLTALLKLNDVLKPFKPQVHPSGSASPVQSREALRRGTRSTKQQVLRQGRYCLVRRWWCRSHGLLLLRFSNLKRDLNVPLWPEQLFPFCSCFGSLLLFCASFANQSCDTLRQSNFWSAGALHMHRKVKRDSGYLEVRDFGESSSRNPKNPYPQNFWVPQVRFAPSKSPSLRRSPVNNVRIPSQPSEKEPLNGTR